MVSTSALEEAIRNLVDNALRHTPPGRTVSVSVRPGATIEVRDRGPGVPLELREEVFEPFWSAACKSQGGAGLGLAIVREALQLHGGSVEIADAAGGGAIFRLVLPQGSVLLRMDVALPRSTSPSRRGRRSILDCNYLSLAGPQFKRVAGLAGTRISVEICYLSRWRSELFPERPARVVCCNTGVRLRLT